MSASIPSTDTRARIERAAEAIIRADGISALTMRRLADQAAVALKTPYNLFGSKTGVLTALLNRVTDILMAELTSDEAAPSLADLVLTLDRLAAFYATDEVFYQGVFWEVMKSGDPEARTQAHGNIIDLITGLIQSAQTTGDLKPGTDPVLLGGQLGLNLLANLGMWAGGHMSITDTVTQTKAVWIALLLQDSATDTAARLQELMVSVRKDAAAALASHG